MTAPIEPGAEYVLAPDLHAPDALAPLVDHPELVGATVDPEEANHVLRGIVMLGRVALARNDVDSYRVWANRSANFVDELQFRNLHGYIPTQYYARVSDLDFFGAMHGEGAATDRLHARFDGVNSGESFRSFLYMCAEHDVNPDAWIEQHAGTPDRRIAAWSAYMMSKRMRAERSGQAHRACGGPALIHTLRQVQLVLS